ncbi:hypothetical protein [Nocardia yamanashiensis]|uniref:hypothetical protein n=1 Tax=Nocardia yamanashiensis TaxID=209247 RepID=UPI0008296C61|nr:hypothetical protein [Nocardia yamanashiensis]
MELYAAVTVDDYRLRLTTVMDDGTTTISDPVAADPETCAQIIVLLTQLRQATCLQDGGTWYSMRLWLDTPETGFTGTNFTYSAGYNFHHRSDRHPPSTEKLLPRANALAAEGQTDAAV